MDGLNQWGRSKDVPLIGLGNSTLDDVTEELAKVQGIIIIGKPDDYGLEKEHEYTTNDYHKVSDEVKPDWDLSGAVEDLQLYLQIGYKVAEADKFPEWKQGAEFKAKRDAMMH